MDEWMDFPKLRLLAVWSAYAYALVFYPARCFRAWLWIHLDPDQGKVLTEDE